VKLTFCSQVMDKASSEYAGDDGYPLGKVGRFPQGIITAGFIIGITLLVAASAVSYVSIVAFRQAVDLHRLSGSVLTNLSEILVPLNEAEIAQRDFLLTGDQEYFQAYQDAAGRIDKEIDDVRRLVKGDPDELRRVEVLQSLVTDGLHHLTATLDVRRVQGLDAAMQGIKAREGQRLEQRIHAVIKGMEESEHNRFARRDAAVVREGRRAVELIGVGDLLALVLLGATTLMAGHELAARRRAEEANQRLAAIVASSDDAIIGTRLDGTITSWNSGAERVYGYRADEICGRTIRRLARTAGEDETQGIFDRLPQLERGEHVEEVHQRSDGQCVDVSVTLSPVRDAAGTLTGASVVARDITDRRHLERLRADFLAMVTHDIKNPLNVILGFVELLQDNPTLDVDARDLVAGLRGSAETILFLVKNYLDLSRIEEGHLGLTRQPVNLAGVLDGVTKSFDRTALSHNVRIEQRIDPAVAEVEGDPSALERVFANLIGNAIKFSPHGGTVTIVGERNGSGVVVKIADEGPGIPSDAIPLIFERYYQSETGRLKKDGTGMGLFIVKSLLEAQNGSVRVESDLGRGSCFEVTLPAPGSLLSTSERRTTAEMA
jgi:PAS domain S-box-containing protein